MVTCSTFSTEIDCALHFQNEFNVKLILLLFMFGYILFALWYSSRDSFSVSGTFMGIFKYVSFKVFPIIMLVFYPFFLLMLRNEVSLELIVTTLTLVYFIILGLFIGLALFYSKEYITEILGDRREIGSKFKYMKR